MSNPASWGKFQRIDVDRLAQKLDHRFHRSAKHAGKKFPQCPRAPYSPKIAKMRNVCQLLRQAITQHQHSYDMTKAIQAHPRPSRQHRL